MFQDVINNCHLCGAPVGYRGGEICVVVGGPAEVYCNKCLELLRAGNEAGLATRLGTRSPSRLELKRRELKELIDVFGHD